MTLDYDPDNDILRHLTAVSLSSAEPSAGGAARNHGASGDEALPSALQWLRNCHRAIAGRHEGIHGPVPHDITEKSPNDAGTLGWLMFMYTCFSDDQSSLDMAITLLRQAKQSGPPSGPQYVVNTYRVGLALCTRYAASDSVADLDLAISELTRALSSARAADIIDAGIGLSVLAHTLRQRFKVTGRLADLNLASEITRRCNLA